MKVKVEGLNYTNTHSPVQTSLAKESLHSLPPTSFGCLNCWSLDTIQLLRLLCWFPLPFLSECCVSEIVRLSNMFYIAAFPSRSLLACSILQLQTQVSLHSELEYRWVASAVMSMHVC